MLLNNIHHPVYVSKHSVSETGHCLHPQVKPTLLGPIGRASPYLWILFKSIRVDLKGQLFKLGLMDDPTCERFLEEVASAPHVLCDCEAIAHLRFRHLGQFFKEPSDYYDAPVKSYISFEVWD
jgi:hypothetical protein